MLMLFQLPTSTELAHPQKWFCWWPQYWYVHENFCSGRSYHVILFGLDIASLLIWEEKYSLEMVLSRTIQQIVGGRGHSQSGWTAGESEDRRRACWRLWTPSSWCSTPGSGTFSGCYSVLQPVLKTVHDDHDGLVITPSSLMLLTNGDFAKQTMTTNIGSWRGFHGESAVEIYWEYVGPL